CGKSNARRLGRQILPLLLVHWDHATEYRDEELGNSWQAGSGPKSRASGIGELFRLHHRDGKPAPSRAGLVKSRSNTDTTLNRATFGTFLAPCSSRRLFKPTPLSARSFNKRPLLFRIRKPYKISPVIKPEEYT